MVSLKTKAPGIEYMWNKEGTLNKSRYLKIQWAWPAEESLVLLFLNCFDGVRTEGWVRWRGEHKNETKQNKTKPCTGRMLRKSLVEVTASKMQLWGSFFFSP